MTELLLDIAGQASAGGRDRARLVRVHAAVCGAPGVPGRHDLACGYAVERPWKVRIFEFWTTPSRISIARRIVGSASQAAEPAITVDTNGMSASLISHVAEFHR